MTNHYWLSLLSFLALFASAEAMHWLITPINHPGAGNTQTVGVYGMLFAGVIVAVWARRLAKRAQSA